MSRKPESGIVRIQSVKDGFVGFWSDGTQESIRWSEVKRIYAYKVDCFTYDIICLAFERDEHNSTLHIPEEVEGFSNLILAAGEIFPEIDPEWYLNVMQPPFVENLTVIFERKPEV